MNDPHKTFWSHFADRLRGHQPTPPADQGWAQMRGLLDATPAAPPSTTGRRGRYATLLLLLLAGLTLGLFADRFGFLADQSGNPSASLGSPESSEVHVVAGTAESVDGSITYPEDLPEGNSESAMAAKPASDNGGEGAWPAASGAAQPSSRTETSPPASSGKFGHKRAGSPENIPPIKAPKTPKADPGMPEPESASSGAVSPNRNGESLPALPMRSAPLDVPGDERVTLPVAMQEGQDHSDTRYGLGWILGLSVPDPVPGAWQTTFSPVAGMFYHSTIRGDWSWQVEMLLRYTRLRDLRYQYRWEDISPQGEYRFLERVQALDGFFSLDLPLLIRYRFHPRWHLEGGLRYSLILEQGSSGSVSGNLPRSAGDMPGRMLWLHDAGMALGAGYHFRGGVSLHLRYTQGLRDLSPDDLYVQRRHHLNSNLQLHIQQNF